MLARLLVSLSLAFAVGLFTLPMITDSAQAAEAKKPSLEVIMYSTATCPYCEKARQWFTSNNVAWVERDVETSETARKQWQDMGALGTPVIVINGKRLNGFTEGALEAEIAKYR